MTRTFMAECFGIDIEQDKGRFVFAGNSPNDAPMFAFFRPSVGVANLLRFLDLLDARPTYVTEKPGGFGFAELAQALLDGGGG